MKKYLVIGGIILLIAALIVPSFINKNTIDEVENKCHFGFQENLAISYGQTANIPIISTEAMLSIELRLGDSLLYSWKNPALNLKYTFDSAPLNLGAYQFIIIAIDSEGNEVRDERMVRILSDVVPEKWGVQIDKVYPHNDSSFTQGLAFDGNTMYEGTGDPNQTGSTVVGEVDLESGRFLKKIGIGTPFFGEGITIFNQELFQITWTNQKCFVYDTKTLVLKREFEYVGEGWGLCTDGKSLIMSDGSERITFRDPNTFEAIRTIEVYTNEGPISKLNELEYIDGFIYANIWTSNLVAVIDPVKGKVIAVIDATNLVVEGKGKGEVLNGIAYNKASGKMYMTGKFWPKLFEVKLIKGIKAV